MAGLRETLYAAQPSRSSRTLEDTLYGPSLEINPADYEQAAIQNTGDLGRGFASAAMGMGAGVQRFVGARDAALETSQEAGRWAPEIGTTDQVTDFGTGARYVAGKVGGGLAYIPLAMGGAAAGRIGLSRALGPAAAEMTGATAVTHPIMAGQEMQRMDFDPATAGMTDSERLLRANAVGLGQSLMEAAVPAALTHRLATRAAAVPLRQMPGEVLKAGAMGAGEEALTSAGSDVIGQAHRLQYDPKYQYDPNQTFEEAVGGAVGMAPISAGTSAVSQGLDQIAGKGGALPAGADLAGRAMRASIDKAAPAAGRAYDTAADLFKTSADFHMQHPEFAGLTTPLTMPEGMAEDDTVGINAFLDTEGAKRNAAAKAMAQRMVDSPDMHSNEDLHAAQSMLTTDDPDAWEAFATGVSLRQKRENIVDALGRFTSYVEGKFGDLKGKAGELKDKASAKADLMGVKHNAERTSLDIAHDDEFLRSMHTYVASAADLGDTDLTMPLHALQKYVLSGMRDEDGAVNVPDELVEALGDKAGPIISKAYDTLRRQGRTANIDADAPKLLQELAGVIKEKQVSQQDVVKLVEDNLTPTAFDQMGPATWPHIAQAVNSYINYGKKDARLEDALEQWFGVNKEVVMAQVAKLNKRSRLRGQELGSEEDTSRDARDFNEDAPSEGAESDYENPLSEFDGPSPTYHFGGKDGQPFDTAYPNVGEHMMSVIKKLDTSRFETIEDDETHKPRVRSDSIGIVDYATQTGDRAALDKLIAEHKGVSKEKLNERFQVLVTNERVRNETEGVDIDPVELDTPAERDGKTVKSSWKDVEEVGRKDVSTIAHGRLYLQRDLPDEAYDALHVKDTFVTSAQKLISKMWEKKGRGAFDENTAEQTGAKDMLNMFASGLASLLDSGVYPENSSEKSYVFKKELKIKLPDGTLKEVDSANDLPDDFVLWSGKGYTLTLGAAKQAKAEGVRKLKDTHLDSESSYIDANTGKKSKKYAEDRKPTDKIEGEDIPTAEKWELREEYARVNKQLLKDEYARMGKGETPYSAAKRRVEIEKLFGKNAWQLKDAKPLPDEVREALRGKLESLEEAGVDLGYRKKGSGAKRQALSNSTEIVGRQVTIIDRDEKGHLFSKSTAQSHAGKNDSVVRHGNQWVIERDIGFKTGVKRGHATETEEMAEGQAEQKDDEKRLVDELTGLELHPKETQSADERVRILEKRIADLRAEYKALNDRIKEFSSKTDVNKVREGNLKKWRGELEAVKAKGLKLGAEMAKLQEALKNTELGAKGLLEKSAEKTEEPSALQKIRDARAKARAEKEPMANAVEKPLVEISKVKLPNRSQYSSKDQAKSDKANKFIGRGSARSSTNAYATAWGNKANTGNYESSDRVFLSVEGARPGRQHFNSIELEKAIEAGATIITDDAGNRAREYNIGEREAAAFLESRGYVEVKPGEWSDPGVKRNKESTSMSDNRPMNDVEAIDLLYKLLGKNIDAAFASSSAIDGSGDWRRDPKTGKASIRIAIEALDPTSVAYHEAMHEFIQRLLDDKHSRASKVLQDAANSEPVLRQMMRHFANEKDVLKQLESDPAERVAYMFQLWAADKLHVGPKTETVFRKIVNFIKKILGHASNDKNALEIMQQFAAGHMSDRGAIARVLDTQESRGAYLRKVGTIMKPVVTSGAEWVGFAENALTGNKNPALDWIGRQLHNKTGSQGDKQAYLSAEAQQNNKWLNKFAVELAKGDKEDVALAVEGLQAKTWHADPVVLSIQKGIASVFDEMYDYMQEAGVKRWDDKAEVWTTVRKVKDYRLPVSWDVEKIVADSERFKNLLFEHHKPALTAIAKQANEEIAGKKHAGKYTASWAEMNNPTGKEVTVEDIADAILKRVLSTNGQVELQESASSIGFSPFAKAVNERTLSNWINSEAFAEFQEKDIANILSAYVGQVTKRAEYSRRFGPDGGILQQKMDEALDFEIDKIMKDKYGIEGAVAKTRGPKAPRINKDGSIEAEPTKGLPAPDNDLASQLAALGENIDGKEILKQATKNLEPARRAIMAMEGTLGHDIGPLMRKANAYSIVYTNVRLLGYAMFSNLIDPLGIMVRGGEFKDAYSTFKRGMRDVAREWGKLTGLREEKPEDRDEAVRVAEMIGTVDNAGFMSTMGTMYGSQYLGKWAREANDNFFRWNGMEAFNKAMRVGATQAAINFIKRHYEKPNKHSERYFKELDLSRDSVQINDKGELNTENLEVQQAIMRWVDGAQLRPNAAIRPTMASDPHYATFYHLKQFMYAMQAVILKRVQVEVKNGNTDPVIMLMAGYVPMMLAADAAKGLLQAATGGGDPYWEHEGLSGIVSHGVQRAGLLGVGQMGVDVVNYGPSGLGGPMVEQAASAATDPIGKTVAEAVAVGPLNMALKGTTWTNN